MRTGSRSRRSILPFAAAVLGLSLAVGSMFLSTGTLAAGSSLKWAAPVRVDHQPPFAGEYINAVSCTTGLCVGVDQGGNVVSSTNPSGGSTAWKFRHVDDVSLDGVSCPSTALCVATDNNSNVLTSTDPAAATPTWTDTDSARA